MEKFAIVTQHIHSETENYLERISFDTNSIRLVNLGHQESSVNPSERFAGLNKINDGELTLCYNGYFAHEFQVKSIETRLPISLKRFNLIDHPLVAVSRLFSHFRKLAHDLNVSHLEPKRHISALVKESLKGKIGYYDFESNIETIMANVELDGNGNSDCIAFSAALLEFVTVFANDVLTTTEHVYILKLMEDEAYSRSFFKKIGINDDVHNSCWKGFSEDYHEEIKNAQDGLNVWQVSAFKKVLSQKFNTYYYPGQTEKLGSYFIEMGADLRPFYEEREAARCYTKLLSLIFSSNRPNQLGLLLDSIEETIKDPRLLEIIINIDTDDEKMERAVQIEQQVRPFVIKYIKTLYPKGLEVLWKPINLMLKEVDSQAYFVLVISDEFLFKTKHWDTILSNYVGMFPDDIFRLKASRNRYRNYFDRWECSFAQDCIAFTTKRWFDITGNFCPCYGPDGFQQAVAFYLQKLNQFNSREPSRDIAINDLNFGGDTPSVGVKPSENARRILLHTKAMFKAQTYAMQLEASRRAAKLLCAIKARQYNLTDYTISDHQWVSHMKLKDIKNQVVEKIYYGVPRFRFLFENFFRCLYFDYYFGGGRESGKNIKNGFKMYLLLRHGWYRALRDYVYSPDAIHRRIYCKVKEILGKIMGKLEYYLMRLVYLSRRFASVIYRIFT